MNDPELEQVMELIRREMKVRGTAAVVVTHDDRMTYHCDRVTHIVEGDRRIKAELGGITHSALQTWSEPVTPGQTRVPA